MFEPAVDGLGWTVGCAGAFEVGQHASGALGQRPPERDEFTQRSRNAVTDRLDQLDRESATVCPIRVPVGGDHPLVDPPDHYGRLGHWFWGSEQQGVVPDIIAVAKAVGNGVPVGAVITSRAVADKYRDAGYFFSSTGGSPLSSRIGLAVLDILRDEDLQGNARDVGGHLKARLVELAQRHEIIGAVHGSGLYLGVELVRDRTTLEPASSEANAICDRMLDLGVVIQPTSDRMNVFKVKPPLCLDRSAADFFVETLDRVLSEGW